MIDDAAIMPSLDMVLVLHAVRAPGGSVADVLVEFANQAWAGGDSSAIGRPLTAVGPSLAVDRMPIIEPLAACGPELRMRAQHLIHPGRLAEFQVTPMGDRILVVAHLLTPEDVLERALRESGARFRLAMDGAPEAIAILHPALKEAGRFADAEVPYANRTALDRWFGGATLEGVTRRRLLATWPSVGAQVGDTCSGVLETGEREDVELRLADGRWLAIAFSRLDGRPLAAIRDVNGQREAEAAIRAQLVSAIERTSISVMVTDRDANAIYANPASERASGYGRDEVIGCSPRFLHGGVQPSEFYADMWSVLTASEPGGARW